MVIHDENGEQKTVSVHVAYTMEQRKSPSLKTLEKNIQRTLADETNINTTTRLFSLLQRKTGTAKTKKTIPGNTN